MKRIVFTGLLTLLTAALIFSQESVQENVQESAVQENAQKSSQENVQEKNLRVYAAVITGLRFEAVGGGADWNKAPDYEWTGPANSDTGFSLTETSANSPYSPRLSLWHDDFGNGFLLDLRYTKNDAGLVVSTELQFLQPSPYLSSMSLEFVNAYAWLDLYNRMFRLSVGHIDDPVWWSPGVEPFRYDTGLGLRFEAKPVEGLNVGFFIRIADHYKDFWVDENGKDKYVETEHPVTRVTGIGSHFIDALLETSFGIRYEHKYFDIAAGLRLTSKATGAFTEMEWGLYPITQLMPDIGSHGYDHKDLAMDMKGAGLRAYAGLGLKMIDNLTLEAGAQFANLGSFNRYGWIWITQRVQYNLDDYNLHMGLNFHQRIPVTDEDFSPKGMLAKDAVKPSPDLEFGVWGSYALGQKTGVRLDTRFITIPGILDMQISPMPGFWHVFGENVILYTYYRFYISYFNEATTGYKDPLIRNAVQVNLEWRF
ncbi:MAG: hypothetical protein LBB72_04750 [Spirochaetaceae bacterium]|jgi:hypothetical protein|nr:hypothetical protein [Spirochaetaceae bacterium]